MSFVKKIWKDRISQFPNRRTINDGYVTKQVTVGRDEGTVTEEGTPFDATEMNDLENRIYAAIEQGGGGGGSSGTYDYTELFNKPRINNHELNGNKTLSDLGIASNADELPIESGSATNTKDYIDSIGITQSVFLPASISTTSTNYNTFNNRKFSDYDYLIFKMGASAYDTRNTVILPITEWVTGRAINIGALHGASSSSPTAYSYSSLNITYNSDTSFTAIASGSATLNNLVIYGLKIKPTT